MLYSLTRSSAWREKIMSNMTVAHLIEMLSEMPEDMPVRIAYQPSYPLQMEVQSQLAMRTSRDGQTSVYLLGGYQPYDAPYAPGRIFEGELEDGEEEGDDEY
jgi:hypothetical protein